jgi:Protein of unknown function (DUF2695)
MRNFSDDNLWAELDELDDYDEPEPERPRLTLSLEQQVALSQAVAAQLQGQPCDGTLRGAAQWAAGSGIEWRRLRRELEENGGYCDCEVLLNIFGGDFDAFAGDNGLEPD